MAKSQATPAQTFGEFFRNKRVRLGFTLRAFCARYGFDPGYISRIERDLLPPSLDDEKLTGLARALKIGENSEEWVLFHDLAYSSKGKLPKDIQKDREAAPLLPAFFRTMRNSKMDKKKLEELIGLLNK